jgi:DNA-binding protein H-NS
MVRTFPPLLEQGSSQTGFHVIEVGLYGSLGLFSLARKQMGRQQFKLDAMSLAELRQLRDEIQTALSGKIQMEREELQEKLDELAKLEAGSDTVAIGQARLARGGEARFGKGKIVSPPDNPGNGKSPLAGRKVEPRYRGPNGETWAGRGQPPSWLTALEASGSSRESFLIPK